MKIYNNTCQNLMVKATKHEILKEVPKLSLFLMKN